MGQKMADIHTPSVPGRSSNDTINGQSGSSKSLMELMNERDNLEAELSALGSVLVSHNVDMDTPLLTPDGFPRSDIDVPQIRTTRARIIWLRNDYKTLMNKIEAGLHAHHAALQAGSDGPVASASAGISGTNASSSGFSSGRGDSGIGSPAQPHAFSNSSLEPPFAKVNSIVSGSPADTAGLQAGDEVRRFGTANWTNHERLALVAQIVGRSEGSEILVKVKRKGDAGGGAQPVELDLKLTPRKNWGGRGMLGCHLVLV